MSKTGGKNKTSSDKIAIPPKTPSQLAEAALTAHQCGDTEKAKTLYTQAIEAGIRHPILYSNLGVIYKNTGRPTQAIECFHNALAIDPSHVEAHGNLGNIFFEQGQLEQALTATLQAIALNPHLANAYLNLGNIRQKQGQLDQALTATRKAIELNPDLADAHLNLGNILQGQGQLDQALAALHEAIQRNPDLPSAHLQLGNVLKEQGQLDRALAATLKAIDLDPSLASAHLNQGTILKEQGKLQQACTATLKAIMLMPECLEAHINASSIYAELADYNKAEQAALKALEIDPNSPAAKNNLSLCQLRKHEYEAGWHNYSFRLQANQAKAGREQPALPPYSRPSWDGSRGCDVFLWSEQGIGDQILFASMLREMQTCCRQLIVSVDARLLPLFQRSFHGNIRFLAKGEIPPESSHQYQLAIADLGAHFRPSKKHFKQAARSFLLADPARTQTLQAAIKSDDQRKTLGISWKSQGTLHANKKKSLPLSLLAQTIHSPGRQLINLQYGDVSAETNQLAREGGIQLVQVPGLAITSDIDGLAALICACDEIVTTSNVTAHLAGALGRPAHLLLPASPHWYWGTGTTTTLWYPSLRLYRQPHPGDWHSPLRQVSQRLAEH